MNYYNQKVLRETFVSGSEITVFDLIASSIPYIAKSDYCGLIRTPLFGGTSEEYDDEEGYGSELYSRFGKCAGSYYYWCKKVSRGEDPETSFYLDVPLIRIECRVDKWGSDEYIEEFYGKTAVGKYKIISEIVKSEFLTLRGIITLSKYFIPEVDDKIIYISVSDEYDPPDDGILDNVVEQKPPEKKPDNNPKTREECRNSDLFKAVSDGLSSVQQKDIIAYSTLTGVFASGDPAFLYIDESLKGRDLPDFISVSYGNAPTGGVGLGDDNTVYRCRLLDSMTLECLKHISYYDRLPEDKSHWLPKIDMPPMIGC